MQEPAPGSRALTARQRLMERLCPLVAHTPAAECTAWWYGSKSIEATRGGAVERSARPDAKVVSRNAERSSRLPSRTVRACVASAMSRNSTSRARSPAPPAACRYAAHMRRAVIASCSRLHACTPSTQYCSTSLPASYDSGPKAAAATSGVQHKRQLEQRSQAATPPGTPGKLHATQASVAVTQQR